MILASILALFWTLLGSIFDTFSASIFACIFGCHFFDFWSKKAPKIYIKSLKNQGCVADVFLERFGAALGCQMLDFRSQNLENITKMVAKNDPKSMKNQSYVADAFLERFGAALGCQMLDFRSHNLQNFTKTAIKIDPKPQKGSKSEPRGDQNASRN